MRLNRYFKIISLLFVCLSLSTCGFKLKHEQSLAKGFSSLALVHKRADPSFINLLENTLQQRGVAINPLAAINLNILSYEELRHAASVNTSTAQQTETRITKELKFSLTTQQGELLIEPTTLRESREYLNDNRNIGGKAEEERMLQKTLNKELVNLMLRHLENEALHKGFLDSDTGATTGPTTNPTKSDIEVKSRIDTQLESNNKSTQ